MTGGVGWNGLGVGLGSLWRLADAETRSISPENFSGAKGAGGMATEGTGADYARDLGIAFQLTNIVRDVGEDARRGRIYLPQEDLGRFNVPASDVIRAHATPAFTALMAFEVERAREWYARALAKLQGRDRRAQRAGLAMAAIYQTLLEEIARDGYRVLERRIALTPLRKLWIAMKTNWRGR